MSTNQRQKPPEKIVHTNDLPEQLDEYRKNQKYTDMTIIIGDKTFPAHEIVLTCFPEIWKKLQIHHSSGSNSNHNDFNHESSNGDSNDRKTKTYKLELSWVHPDIFDCLLTYLYTRTIILTVENALQLCEAFHYFKLQHLLTGGEKYLCGVIDTANVLDLYFLADKLSLVCLGEKCMEYIVGNTKHVLNNIKEKRLQNFPAADLEKFFINLNKHKNRSDKHERVSAYKEHMFIILILWTEQEPNIRASWIDRISKIVPYSDLSSKFLEETAKTFKNTTCIKFLRKRQKREPETSITSVKKIRIEPQEPSNKLFFIGGRDGQGQNLADVSYLNLATNHWHTVDELEVPTAYGGAVTIKDKIYFAGGTTTSKNGRFRTLANFHVLDCTTGKWKELQSMPAPRSNFGMVAYDDHIYIAGGAEEKGRRLSWATLFRYSIKHNTWDRLRDMKQTRSPSHLIEFNGNLYAIGGFGIFTVEKFDIKTGEWEELRRKHKKICNTAITKHNDKFYICGEELFEQYSPVENSFTSLELLDDKNGRALVSVDDKLWAVGGGSRSEGGTNSIDVFDFKNPSRWTRQKTTMMIARRDHVAVLVKC